MKYSQKKTKNYQETNNRSPFFELYVIYVLNVLFGIMGETHVSNPFFCVKNPTEINKKDNKYQKYYFL